MKSARTTSRTRPDSTASRSVKPAAPVAEASNSAAHVAECLFGPVGHNAWRLGQECLSLVRQPRSTKPVRFDALSQAIEIDLARSALVVVDMQNDFCHPSGWFGQKGISVKPMRRPIAAIASLLPAWRATGAPVVWLNWGVRPDRLNLSPTVQFKGKRSAQGVGYAEASPEDRGLSVVAGQWGAQVVDELQVGPEDITVFKHRLSGFWDNELDSILRQQGITTLLFAGVNTDRCVFSSLQDAGFLGYDCVLLSDACSTPSPAYVSKAIHFIVQQLHGFVASTHALLPALRAAGKGAGKPARNPNRKQENITSAPSHQTALPSAQKTVSQLPVPVRRASKT